jgi:hypothetical protein
LSRKFAKDAKQKKLKIDSAKSRRLWRREEGCYEELS